MIVKNIISKRQMLIAMSVFLAGNLVLQLLLPVKGWALTSGPTQPEVTSFEPAGTNQMVDKFTGDFTYNIPLFTLPGPDGGYPFNLAYHSGISMDQEASWVGLGWTLNPGAVNRSMRGIPDEFSGDKITTFRDMAPNVTTGGRIGANVEVWGGSVTPGVGIGVKWNRFRGIGYSIDPSLSFHTGNGTGSMNAGLNFGFKISSQEGVGVRPRLSLSNSVFLQKQSFNVGIGYNSKRGLTDLTMRVNLTDRDNDLGDGNSWVHNSYAMGVGGKSSISFSNTAYSPGMAYEMEGRNATLTFKLGGSVFGVFGNVQASGFYSRQVLKNRRENTEISAYGYLNMHKKGGDRVLLDCNREKDGMIREESPNLPIPGMTHDVYNATAQGMSGSFRPFRNDAGVLHDQKTESRVVGGGLGGELGPAPHPHIGGSGDVNMSWSKAGTWEDHHNLDEIYAFRGKGSDDPDVAGNPVYEPWYFKSYGEHTSDALNELDHIGGTAPVHFQLHEVDNEFKPENAQGISDVNTTENREPRNQVFQPITNEQLMDDNNAEALGRYKFNYYYSTTDNYYADPSGPYEMIRDEHKGHHIAGYTALKGNGRRYVYGLPAMNKTHEEYIFSTNGLQHDNCQYTTDVEEENYMPKYEYDKTRKFFEKKEIPEYAHSYLLTSVLGNNYVDADDTPGPSDGDFGHWVKFTYRKMDDYKWRAPFFGANYMRGNAGTAKDDKASFMYGEKEKWHLATAETRSHIALFHISQREDGRGAAQRIQNSGDAADEKFGEYAYKLDSISLYTKSEYEEEGQNATPLKQVHFEYADAGQGEATLCENVHNRQTNGGKLTLKKIWFTYEDNSRGELSPYEFDYNAGNAVENPDYARDRYDRWGTYDHDNQGTACHDKNFPYTRQDASASVMNTQAAVWNLKAITTPSGSRIQVNYERDDYNYVQNKRAMQMYDVAGLSGNGGSQPWQGNFRVGDGTDHMNRRVYFPLEKSRPGTWSDERQDSLIREYVDWSRKYELYFKLRMKLRGTDEELEDYVEGYADVDKHPDKMGLVKTGGNDYTHGYITVKLRNGHHPFNMAAWQHLRVNNPRLMTMGGNVNHDPNTTEGEYKARIKSLGSVWNSIKQVFTGYYDYCSNHDWGDKLIGDQCWIRLNSVDGKKYGGGNRVKKLVMQDRWNSFAGEGEDSEYGQVYDYTTTNEDGKEISSGVAAYEPMIGGDENPLRYAKQYEDNIPLKSNNRLYFEYPVNENYYPAPTVGYSKVTVKSLATHKRASEPALSDIQSTGASVHEFYTAKDYPVISRETEVQMKPNNLIIPALIFTSTKKRLTASQGYSIALNDMHGRPEKVSEYPQGPDGNIQYGNPVSYVKYHYRHDTVEVNGKPALRLDNELPVLLDDPAMRGEGEDAVKAMRRLGVDYEFFTDMRENRTRSVTGGVDVNNDIIILPPFVYLPAFVPWPNAGYSMTRVRTIVSNKVIHRSGIVKKISRYNQGSHTVTNNKLFDAQTGRPLLTTTNNNYDDSVYNYKIPGHIAYENMGAAYRNIGMSINTPLNDAGGNDTYYFLNNEPQDNDKFTHVRPGDEYLIRDQFDHSYKGVVTRKRGDTCFLSLFKDPGQDILSVSGSQDFNLLCIRSGRKNRLTTDVQQLTAMHDPTAAGSRTETTCGEQVTRLVPEEACRYYACTISMLKYIRHWFVHHGPDDLGPVMELDTVGHGWVCEGGVYGISGQGPDPALLLKHDNSSNDETVTFYDDNLNNEIPLENINSIVNIHTYNKHVNCETYVNVDVLLENGDTVLSYVQRGQNWGSREALLPGQDGQATQGVYATNYLIDSIISIRATSYNNHYPADYSSWKYGDFADKHPYITGERGVWRPEARYEYAGKRNYAADVNPAKDGIMNDVTLFNFNNADMYCDDDWRKTSTAIEYNIYGSGEDEKNILGNHNAALFGFEGRKTLAVAQNSRNNEMAFEGFEQYGPGKNPLLSKENNFVFFQSDTEIPIDWYHAYEVVIGNGQVLFVDYPYEGLSLHNKKVRVSGGAVNNYADKNLNQSTFSGYYEIKNAESLNGGTFIALDRPVGFSGEGNAWKGYIQLPFGSNQYAEGEIKLSETFAHTGTNSIYVQEENAVAPARFQPQLDLRPGKKYVISGWVSRKNNETDLNTGNTELYNDIGFKILFKDSVLLTVRKTDIFAPEGPVINQWQKVIGNFTLQPGEEAISIQFTGGAANGGNKPAYYDDIRIFPAEGNMRSFVYDPGTLRLRAMLDNNNYATIYFYDQEGNLYLKKKETEKGIKTLQESFVHRPER